LEQTELVGSVLERLNTIDLWQPDSLEDIKFTQTVDFIVSQEEAFEFERRVGNATDVRTVTLIEDAGELIAQQSVEQKRATKGLRGASYPYDQFLTYSQLEEWILANDDGELMSSEIIGETFEGRKIYGVHLGDQDPTSDKKKIFMECNIHAREWITPSTCRYFIHMLKSAKNGVDLTPSSFSMQDLLYILDHNWYIIVSMNPDGYQYTFDSDRMWRKNREPNQGSQCVGTDLNRQFPVGHLTEGGSPNPCHFGYAGTAPFTTREANIWRDWFMQLRNAGGGDIQAQISVHSYSQLIMPPWASDRNAIPDEPEDTVYQMEVANRMKEAAFDTHGKVYIAGQSRDVLGYPAGGMTEDYAYGELGVKLSMLIELRDTGDFGFLLPATEIIPTAEELVAMLIQVSKSL